MRKSILVLFASGLFGAATACAPSQQPIPQTPLLPSPTTGAAATATQSVASSECPSSSQTYQVGYRVAGFSDVKAAVWYPSAAAESTFAYGPDISSSVSKDGQPLTSCGTFPLVVFSHGLFGCAIQSIFFTETLARHGYIVVAPDHQDAKLCSVDGTKTSATTSFLSATEPPVTDPKTWTDSSYRDRQDSIEKVLDGVLQDSQLKPLINVDQIGIAGHSLGGYTALGMVGGWPSWKDSRFKAALLMSPYSMPFSTQQTLKEVTAPLMYQGAEFDVGITPFVEGRNGAYAQSNPPKYFMKLRGGNHFTWTNAVCAGSKTIADCLQSKPAASLIDDYGIAFFEMYLKGKPQALLTAKNRALADFEYQP